MLKLTCQASVPRDVLPPTPPGPEGSNGNGLLRVQWVPGAWLFVFWTCGSYRPEPSSRPMQSRKDYPMIPSVGEAKFTRFGKIAGRSDAATPNHCASVAAY